MRKRLLFTISLILLLNATLASAISQQEISEAKTLIDSKADCKSLSDPQFEILGEYYMEQMHPGESHELMHKMMGLEEGSDSEKQFHISMAKTIYCGESGMMGSGGMMGGQSWSSMMGRQGYISGYWTFEYLLYVIFLIGLIILVYLWIVKLLRDFYGKKK
ncbi:hypothetical protein HYY74_04105 [Candidatus Woesearchaeota archaeon]|nr:hypothetical protein [Candidatus Woesearchaeota archaeon]